jgi:hypothetical protein
MRRLAKRRPERADEVERRQPRSPRQLIDRERSRVVPIDERADDAEITCSYFFSSP